MNEKIILPFRKLKFETQLNMGFSAKDRSYLAMVMFMIVVVVVFLSIFYLEIHQNNIFFYFLKFIFDIRLSKQFKIIKK